MEAWQDLARPLLSTLEQDLETGEYDLRPIEYATERQKANAVLVKEKAKQMLEPASSEAIGGHISLMLQHYYKEKLPPAVHEGIAMQWLECLENFPEWAVKKAVMDYLRGDEMGRKPKPGQIVKLANEAVGRYRAVIRQCDKMAAAPLPPPKRVPPTPEQKAEVSRIVAEAQKNLKMGPDVIYGPNSHSARKSHENSSESKSLEETAGTE